LKPLRQLFLRTFLTKIIKERESPLFTIFIFKDRGSLLTSEADAIPQVGIFRIALEAPNEYPSWYPAHALSLLLPAISPQILKYSSVLIYSLNLYSTYLQKKTL
jgi:hypothetical protein